MACCESRQARHKSPNGRQIRGAQYGLSIYGHYGGVDSLSFSPDGRLLATSGRDHAIKLWDLHSGEALHEIEAHDKPILTLAFSPDGRYLASGGGDNAIYLGGIPTLDS